MSYKASIGFCSACVAFCAAPLAAQEKGRIITVPFERGVYYDTSEGVINLPMSVFLPMVDSSFQELLGVGARKLAVGLPGSHSAVTIFNPKPTFYLRGYRPGSQLYLVRSTQRGDQRRVLMSKSRHFTEWARFRTQDLTDVEVEVLADGLATVRPRTDLGPGEYVIVSPLEQRFEAIRLAFSFGITRGP